MKGQVFLIGAIIIVISIVLLRNLYGIYDTLEEKRWVESVNADQKLKNIVKEYKYAAGISTAKWPIDADYLREFSVYLRNDTDLSVLYLFSYSNGTRYDVTLGNFLGARINATVNVTQSAPLYHDFGIVEDKTNVTTSFVSDINGTIAITLSYTLANDRVTENILLTIANNSASAVFDAKIKENDIMVRSKEIFNRTW